MNKLIILRGPSGAGKSTIAKLLFKKTKNKTCLIEQDYYRFIFGSNDGGSRSNSDAIHKMIESNVLIALQEGYDVILEGILSVKSYAQTLENIFKKHPKENYIFYFDISLTETIRRHALRYDNKKYRYEKEGHKVWGEKEMKKWYPNAHKSNHQFEILIPENFSIKKTVQFIKKYSGI